jgi:hypothetical protein
MVTWRANVRKAIIKSKDNFVVTAKVREKSKQMFEENVESCLGILKPEQV